MRLIDADKLMESLDPKESVWVGLVLSELIANAPTVKAIPIEWIENWKRGKSSIEQVVADKIMMDYKYRDYWEKENDRNQT